MLSPPALSISKQDRQNTPEETIGMMATTKAVAVCGAMMLTVLSGLSCSAADTYPSKPITWVVPFTPGGITDTTGRMIAKALSEKIGQPVLIDNKPGAGGVVGTEAVVKAKPDGYTIVYGTAGTIATNPVLYKLSFDPAKDLIPVHAMGESPVVIAVNPKAPFKTVAELVAYAKKNPEKVTFASAGAGTTSHLSGELFQFVTGTKLTHIPYKGSIPAMTDVISGVVDMTFDYPVTTMPQLEAGKVRVLAVLTPERLKVMPDVPTIAEAGYPKGQLGSWSGIFLPAGTSPDITAKLSAAFGEALKDPEIVKYYADNGQVLLPDMSADKFAPFIAGEMPKWKDLVEKSGAKTF
jgi:tripartite-type tricarboxylate transporter receptor subunit TctC